MGAPSDNAATVTGAMNLWIDGVEYGSWSKLWLRTSAELKLSIFHIALFHQAAHSVEGMMIDTVVVAKKRIGIDPVISE